jgi:hypothetical protein
MMEEKKYTKDEILETMYAALYSLEGDNPEMALMQGMMYPSFVILVSLLDYEGKNGDLNGISKMTNEEKAAFEKQFDKGYEEYRKFQRDGGKA